MFSYQVVAVTLALVVFAHGGQEAPPAKAVTYNVPSVAKVSYPGPTVTKSVETYSAPSIEKTTLITRTITSPLNAPAVKSVTYSAPAVPVHAAAAPVHAYGAPAYAAAPHPHYAAYPQVAYAGHGQLHGGYGQLGFAGIPAYAGFNGYAPQGINGATVYSAPALVYSLGHQAAVGYAAAPVAAAYGAPAAAAVAAPVAEYAPAAAAGGY